MALGDMVAMAVITLPGVFAIWMTQPRRARVTEAIGSKVRTATAVTLRSVSKKYARSSVAHHTR